MKMQSKPIAITAMLALLLAITGLPALAQHEGAQHGDMMVIGKKGILLFDTPVRVGDNLLKPGDYQIQHVMEGQDHVIVFTRMTTAGPGGNPESRPTKDVTRMKCRIEPLGEKAKHSGLRFGTNAAGEKTVEEVHIKGENVKHVF